MKKAVFYFVLNLFFITANAQTKWVNMDSLYQPLPASVHVYKSTDSLDGKPNIMYYAPVEAGAAPSSPLRARS